MKLLPFTWDDVAYRARRIAGRYLAAVEHGAHSLNTLVATPSRSATRPAAAATEVRDSFELMRSPAQRTALTKFYGAINGGKGPEEVAEAWRQCVAAKLKPYCRDSHDGDGHQAMVQACRRGDEDVCAVLEDFGFGYHAEGADSDSEEGKSTALQAAVCAKAPDLVGRVLAAGASAEEAIAALKRSRGPAGGLVTAAVVRKLLDTSLPEALVGPEALEEVLLHVARQGDTAAVVALLEAGKVSAHPTQPSREPPLHAAAAAGHAGVVNRLLKGGALLHATYGRRTALEAALEARCLTAAPKSAEAQVLVVQVLLRRGAKAPPVLFGRAVDHDAVDVVAAYFKHLAEVEKESGEVMDPAVRAWASRQCRAIKKSGVKCKQLLNDFVLWRRGVDEKLMVAEREGDRQVAIVEGLAGDGEVATRYRHFMTQVDLALRPPGEPAAAAVSRPGAASKRAQAPQAAGLET